MMPVDVKAALKKATLNKDKVIMPSGANPAKGKRGREMVSEAQGQVGAQPELKRPKVAELNDRLAHLKAETEKILAQKAVLQKEEDARQRAKPKAHPANAPRASRGRAAVGRK